METIIFDFESFLQKHFGLVGPLHSDLDPDTANFEDHDIKDFFTDEGWDAWQRAIDLMDDLQKIGLISEDVQMDIVHSFCDNSF